MATFVSATLIAVAILLAIPAAVIFSEVVAAILPWRAQAYSLKRDREQQVAVIIPAHDEGTNLLPTIEDIKGQVRSHDRILVVADNCSDNTADIAGGAGVEVTRRNDATKIGKGYALDFGLKHLASNPPGIVVIIDADCRAPEGTIDRLAAACAMSRRPVQAPYLLNAPPDSGISYRVAEFALRLKNWLRPLGLNALNLPCQLMGTGMAFPWDVIRRADLASGSIVEDLKLGLDLARLGSAPLFCVTAAVSSNFPFSESGAKTQRERWEAGHVRLILAEGPRLILSALMRRNLGLLALTLDLAVPPLSLYVSLLGAMIVITAAATYFGASAAALITSIASLLLLTMAVLLAWLKCGRDILPASALTLIATFLLGKLPLYFRLLRNRAASQWVRTDRQKLD